MNAHEIALAAHTRAESAAQGRDSYLDRLESSAVATILAGNEVSTGRDAFESVGPADVFEDMPEASKAAMLASCGELRGAMNMPQGYDRESRLLALASRIYSIAYISTQATVRTYLPEIEAEEIRAAKSEAAFDRAERAQ